MHENPWTFDIGDLVTVRRLAPNPSSVALLHVSRVGSGMIVDRRRNYVHVMDRPVRIAECDEYQVVLDDKPTWVPVEALTLTQSLVRDTICTAGDHCDKTT